MNLYRRDSYSTLQQLLWSLEGDSLNNRPHARPHAHSTHKPQCCPNPYYPAVIERGNPLNSSPSRIERSKTFNGSSLNNRWPTKVIIDMDFMCQMNMERWPKKTLKADC